MYRSIVVIQSVATEIRRGKKTNAVWLMNTTKVPCSNDAKMQNPLTVGGVPQIAERISAISRPKFTILAGRVEEVLLFNKFFFRLLIHALVPKI